MLDYPQQLAVAAMVRWIGDPVRAFGQAYELALWHPQGLFETLTAGLAWVMPIEAAGKVVVSLSLAAVLPAAAALCRRAGRPAWYGLLALAVTYGHSFFWGFVDSLVAAPLFLAGLALADRLLDRPFGWKSWLLVAGSTLIFYGAHLQMLMIFAGSVGWLAMARRPPVRRLAIQLSALAPGVALGAGLLGWLHLHAAEAMTGFQRSLETEPTVISSTAVKWGRLPGLLFGVYADDTQGTLGLILLGLILVLAIPRGRRPGDEGVQPLERYRFAGLAGWILLLFFLLPEFSSGYLVSERLAPLAVMAGAAGLPVPSRRRQAAAGALLGVLMALQLSAVMAGFRIFAIETAGLRDVLEAAEPGEPLAGLIYELGDSTWTSPADMMRHVPAYYQVFRGGRVALSFAQFFNAPVRYRAGANWEDAVLAGWQGASAFTFDFERDGGCFRYFLVRGGRGRLDDAFGPHLASMKVTSVKRWHLVDRGPREDLDSRSLPLSLSSPCRARTP